MFSAPPSSHIFANTPNYPSPPTQSSQTKNTCRHEKLTLALSFSRHLPCIEGQIQDKTVTLSIDTGASINLFPSSSLPPQARPFSFPVTVSGIANQPVSLTHAVTLPVKLNNRQFSIVFHLVPFTSFPVLLGNQFLKSHKSKIDFENKTVELTRLGYKPPSPSSETTHKVGKSALFSTAGYDVQKLTFSARYTYIIPPRSMRMVPVFLPMQTANKTVHIHSPHINKHAGYIVHTLVDTISPKVPLVNVSNQAVTIRANTPVASGTVINQDKAVPIFTIRNIYEPTETDRQTNIQNRKRDIGHLIDPSKFNIDPLPPHEEGTIRNLLSEHATVFNWHKEDFTRIKTYEVQLNLMDNKPYQNVQFTIPYKLRPRVKEKILSLLHQGVIQPSNSPFRNNILAIPKPHDPSDIRIVLDLRSNNQRCQQIAETLQTIPNVIEKMANSKHFHRLDLKMSFFQLQLHPDDRPSTAFSVRDLDLPNCQYEMTTLPQGSLNSAISLQRVLKHIFQDVYPNNIAMYVDDFFIFGKTLREINTVLKSVLQTAEKHSVLFNLEKSAFGLSRLKCLGHLISNGTVKPDPDKIEAMAAIPKPTTVKQLRSWLAAVNFYRNFFPNISLTLAPLYDALKGNPRKLIWNEERDKAYDTMRSAMTSAPLLQIFSTDNTEHLVMTDSSSVGVGACLQQRKIGTEQ